MGVCSPSHGRAYFLVVPIAEDFPTKRLDFDFVSAIGVVVLATLLVVIGEYMSVPPGFLIITLVCMVIILMAINTPIFNRHRVGLSCISSGQRQYTALNCSHYDYWRDGLVCPPCRPSLCPCGRPDEYRRDHASPRYFRPCTCRPYTRKPWDFHSSGRIHFFGDFRRIGGRCLGDGFDTHSAMKRGGYRPEQAVSIVASASAMGMLVPHAFPWLCWQT